MLSQGYYSTLGTSLAEVVSQVNVIVWISAVFSSGFFLKFPAFFDEDNFVSKTQSISVSDTFLCRKTNCLQKYPTPHLKTDGFKLLITDIEQIKKESGTCCLPITYR